MMKKIETQGVSWTDILQWKQMNNDTNFTFCWESDMCIQGGKIKYDIHEPSSRNSTLWY